MRLKLIYIYITALLVFIPFFTFSQNSIPSLLKIRPVKRTFSVDGLTLTLNEININNKESKWFGLKIAWIILPKNLVSIQVKELGQQVSPASMFRNSSTFNEIISLNGSFYRDENNKRISDGLVIVNKIEVSQYNTRWNEGGFLIQDESDFAIWPIKAYRFLNFSKILYALQSYPIVVDSFKNAIHDNSIEKANRIGIGITRNGSIVVCAVINDDYNEKMSLFEFGQLLTIPNSNSDYDIETFLALDGGPSVSFFIPNLNYFIGHNSLIFIPNTVHIIKK